MKLQSFLWLQLLLVRFSDAWTTPLTNSNSPLRQRDGTPSTTTTTARNAFSTPPQSTTQTENENEASTLFTTPAFNPLLGATQASLVALAALAACPGEASAAVTVPSVDVIDIATAAVSSTIVTAGGSLSSALFAYGHYFSIIAIVGIVMTERWTLENGPNMTEEEENRLAIADTLYGAVGLLIVYTGYYRLSDPALGKGTYFYIHEPVFWLKMAMVGVLGAASLFNTTKIIQRSITRFSGEDDKVVEPMSEELCNRMKSICNAELTGIVFIPMAATFMTRGIGYNESIPWQAEAAGVALIFLGLGFKYVKEALTFEERLLETKKETETNTNTMIS
jgi:putative membrane protein